LSLTTDLTVAPRSFVCWRVRTDDPDVASVRLRCLVPAGRLEEHGLRSRISWGRHDPLGGPPPEAIVFVKTFEERDRELAERAVAAGVPVVLDVCDNVYARDYRPPAAPDIATFERMAELADAIVTTGPGLADALTERLGRAERTHVVPDPAETIQEARRAPRALLRERLANLVGPGRAPAAGLLRPALGRALDRSRASLRARRSGSARRDGGLPQVIWFGNTGSTSPRYGLVNLVDIADQLAAAARKTPFRLLVVSADPGISRERLAGLPIETEHIRWDRLGIFGRLRESSVAVVPNSRDEFSICKSANRPVLALSNGVPVVASRVPSLAPLEGCLLADDFQSGVSTYLGDAGLRRQHLRAAAPVLEREFSGEAVARAWRDVLGPLTPGG